jgi:F0F1-type ATP synthase epsilon subunit
VAGGPFRNHFTAGREFGNGAVSIFFDYPRRFDGPAAGRVVLDAMSFRCVIVTPEQQELDESASQVILPAHDGQIGILTDRAPLLVKLGKGLLRVDLPAGQKKFFQVRGGVAQMKDNKLTILTEESKPASPGGEAAAAE